MPRESTSSSETVKRAPRKRVARVVKTPSVVEPSEVPRRKAPTNFASEIRPKGKSYKTLYISIGILLVGFGAAAMIGYSDKGQINIAGVITERNERVSSGKSAEGEGETTSNTIVPVQNTNNTGLPDGGLVGAGTPPPVEPTPVEEVASSTDESADSSATSTEEVTEEDSSSTEEANSADEPAPEEAVTPTN